MVTEGSAMRIVNQKRKIGYAVTSGFLLFLWLLAPAGLMTGPPRAYAQGLGVPYIGLITYETVCDGVDSGPSMPDIVFVTVDSFPPSISVALQDQDESFPPIYLTGTVVGNGSISGTYIDIPAGGQPAEESGTFTGQLTGIQISLSLSGTVQISDSGPPCDESIVVTATETMPPSATSDLSITGTGSPGQVASGAQITYSLTVSNAGPNDATDVVVTFPTPTGTTVASATASQGTIQGSSPGSTGNVVFSLGTIANGGAATLSLAVNVQAAGGSTIGASASVTSNSTDPNLANNAVTISTQVLGGGTPPDILGSYLGSGTETITCQGQSPVTTSGAAELSILTQQGQSFTGSFFSASYQIPLNGTVDASGDLSGTYTILNGSIQVGSGTFTGQVTGNQLQASFMGTIIEGGGVDEICDDSVTITATLQTPSGETSDLSITGTGSPGQVASGAQITYSLTVSNAGPNDATGVVVTFPTPTGTTVGSAMASQGTIQGSSPGSTGNVVFSLGAMANGAAATLSLTVNVQAAAGPTILASVSVTSNSTDPNLANNTVTISTPVTQTAPSSDLSITGTGSSSQVVTGAQFTYSFIVRNTGPDAAADVLINLPTPAGTTFASATTSQGQVQDSGPGSTGGVVFALGTMATGDTATVFLTVHVLAPASSIIVAAASVLSDSTDPNPANNMVTISTPVIAGGVFDLAWEQPAPTVTDPTPAPEGLRVVVGAPASAVLNSGDLTAQGSCTLTNVNIYKSDQSPVQTIPSNRWLMASPSMLQATMAVAPGGSFYVITNVWNCNGTMIESAPSNEASVPPGPTITQLKVTGKLKAVGTGFSGPVQVLVNGVGFVKSAVLRGTTTVVQKGPLTDGTPISSIGATTPAVVTIVNEDGGIGSFVYKKPRQEP
jgi:uncharacterized repeat protein (TIGR01451 family)